MNRFSFDGPTNEPIANPLCKCGREIRVKSQEKCRVCRDELARAEKVLHPKPLPTKKCVYCKKDFQSAGATKYCSKACNDADKKLGARRQNQAKPRKFRMGK